MFQKITIGGLVIIVCLSVIGGLVWYEWDDFQEFKKRIKHTQEVIKRTDKANKRIDKLLDEIDRDIEKIEKWVKKREKRKMA